MLGVLWLIPALPLLGFVLVLLTGGRAGTRIVAAIGVGSVGLSAVVAALVTIGFLTSPPPGNAHTQVLWRWAEVAGLSPRVAFYLDPLSVIMVMVVTFVAFLILLFSAEFMRGDEGYSRFFAFMDLFVGSMLILVLADNLLLLFLGWEGVGLCSYLLIGFWYRERANGRAAVKAFIVTRVGDTAMLVGLFLLFTQLGTLAIQELMVRAGAQWAPNSGLAVAAAALLLAGAVGKSAQLPLQTWLPDAMAGPSPVSALIHAATMVTAGVYIIARTHALFELAPAVQTAVAVIGAATLVYAGCSALTQWDIKRVLAYSTISQIGYMFVALGVGAWAAAIFHLMIHAFFKALLFLSAGVVIQALDEEHDIHKMGGLRRELPWTFWTFLAGAASLSALPLVTAGFYSKDLILSLSLSSARGGPWLWAAGLLGAFLTSLYAFRVVFVAFFGPVRRRPRQLPGRSIRISMTTLAVLSVIGGFIELPRRWAEVQLFTKFLERVLPTPAIVTNGYRAGLAAELAPPILALAGIYVIYLVLVRRPRLAAGALARPAVRALGAYWLAGWGFDWLYQKLFVAPFFWFARVNRNDLLDLFFTGIARVTRTTNGLLILTQNGLVRRYALAVALGAVAALAVGVFR